MNRRDFGRTLAGAALGSAALHQGALKAGGSAFTGGESSQVPYKISVMLWAVFRDLPFEQKLEKVAEAGYRAAQLVSEFKDWTEEGYRKVNAKRRSLGLIFDTVLGNGRYTSQAVSLTNPSERENFLSDIRFALSAAQKLECPTMIVVSGNRVEGMSDEAQHESIVEGLKRAAEIVEGKGVTLVLENINLEENPRYYLWKVPEAFQIIAEVNHPQVKFLYDFYHGQISGGNLLKHLQDNVDKLGAVHIADVPGRHEPGTGEINYRNIYKKLAELGFPGYVAMEFYPTGDPVATLRAAREEALRGGRG